MRNLKSMRTMPQPKSERMLIEMLRWTTDTDRNAAVRKHGTV